MQNPLRRAAAAMLASATLVAGLAVVTMPAPAAYAAVVTPPPPPAPTPARVGPPASMVVLGDSISQGTGSDDGGGTVSVQDGGIGSPRLENSWATGDWSGLQSNFQRIRALPGGSSVTRLNLSANGANMRNQFLAQAQSVPAGTGYVMVEMGGNDLCRPTEAEMTSEADYRAQFKAGLDWLKANRPETLVFVASVPDIYNLWYVRGAAHQGEYFGVWPFGSTAAGPRATRGSEDSSPFWARQFWDGLFGSVIPCKSLLVDPTNPRNAGPTPTATHSSEARRLRVRARNIAFNNILSQECAVVLRCNFDDKALFNFSANRVNGSLTHNTGLWQFKDRDISTQDHFHPSFTGQQKLAANTFAASYDFTDRTAPTVALTPNPVANGNGWNRTNVTVTVSGSDAAGIRGFEYRVRTGSGTPAWTQVIGNSNVNVTVSAAGVSNVEARSLDANGNVSASSFRTVAIDRTAPQVSLTTPTAEADYEQNAEVTAEYSCSDAAGGADVASCVGTVADGALIDTSTVGTKQFSVTATDGAGNQTTVTRSYTVIDVTAPTIDLRNPADGASLDRHATVEADYDCVDEPGGSGLASCDGTVPDGGSVDTATIGDKDFTVEAADNAGNSDRVTHTYTVVDVTAPTITLSAPGSGAVYDHHQVVNADFTCEDDDGGIGIADGYCVGTVPNGDPVDTSTLGTHTFQVTGTDRAGNEATVTHTYTVVDVTAPTVSSSNDGIEYKLGQPVPAQFTCTDEPGGSGVASCTGPGNLDTSSVGTKTYSVVTTDNAGNTRTATVTYRVTYAYGEVRQPINANGSSVFKTGSTVPVKFGLTDYAGTPVGTATPTISYTSLNPEGIVDEQSTEPVYNAPATGGTQLRWDATSNQYIFNLGTKTLKVGTYKLIITLDDGKQYGAIITLK